MVNEKKKNY